jgi:hypothetical protein
MYTYIVERTQIYLSRAQASALDREAKRSGRTRSHLIREAIDDKYLTAAMGDRQQKALAASFGGWRHRRETGVEYVQRIRSTERLQRQLSGERAAADEADAKG